MSAKVEHSPDRGVAPQVWRHGAPPTPALHVIVAPREWLLRGARRMALEAAQAGADYLHLRVAGEIDLRRALQLGRELQAGLEQSARCRLVVNDRVDLALALGANGVQLPEHSFSVTEARALMLAHVSDPGVCGSAAAARRGGVRRCGIGASRHDPRGVAAAARDGADWIILGHLYATPSHPGEPPLTRAVRQASLLAAEPTPLIAIGGISAARVEAVVAEGFGGVAVRGAALDADGATTSLVAIRRALDHAWSRRAK
jgi:thiamine monophosphate synthase